MKIVFQSPNPDKIKEMKEYIKCTTVHAEHYRGDNIF